MLALIVIVAFVLISLIVWVIIRGSAKRENAWNKIKNSDYVNRPLNKN